MAQSDAGLARDAGNGAATHGEDRAGSKALRSDDFRDPPSLGEALRALADVRGRLVDVQHDNENLHLKNEQLLQRLVSVSRRAAAATRLAHHDGLTGLPNRLLLIKRLQRAIADAREHRQLLALLFIDLDGFKAVNDRLGHKAGDRLLAVVAARIASCVRSDDIACRYGGDEFVALLCNLEDPVVAVRTSQAIRESIGRRYLIEGQAIQLTASVGVAVYPSDGTSYDALLNRADTAMYHAKAARRSS